MVYLWILLGLIVSIIALGIANIIVTKVTKKKNKLKEQEE